MGTAAGPERIIRGIDTMGLVVAAVVLGSLFWGLVAS
jgi:hypothetical protein